MRNFEIALDDTKRSDLLAENGVSELKREESKGGGVGGRLVGCMEDLHRTNAESLRNLSPEVLNYIQQLESELSSAKQVMSLLHSCHMNL